MLTKFLIFPSRIK
uniref:Uncharacterized protein n=1 Tax=Arundo donax TaxID=35708 RepID=A0A0A9HFC5_ARUDO